MPCVCLSNTFRQWQTFRALNSEKRNRRRLLNQDEHSQRRLANRAKRHQRHLDIQAKHNQRRLARQNRRAARQAQNQLPQLAPDTQPATSVTPQAASRKDFAREGEIWRIPHQRKSILSSSASVSQTLTAAISTQLHDMVTPASSAPTPALVYPIDLKPGSSRADLINAESRLGGTIFGPIPAGHRREFFHDRQNVWIWHEDWQDQAERPHEITVRYEVRTSGIYKKIAKGKYLRLDGDELENFRLATKTYLYLVKKYLYKTSTDFYKVPIAA